VDISSPGPVEQQDCHEVAGHRKHREDGQLNQDVVQLGPADDEACALHGKHQAHADQQCDGAEAEEQGAERALGVLRGD
jgi:hypothetical protein